MAYMIYASFWEAPGSQERLLKHVNNQFVMLIKLIKRHDIIFFKNKNKTCVFLGNLSSLYSYNFPNIQSKSLEARENYKKHIVRIPIYDKIRVLLLPVSLNKIQGIFHVP